MYIVPGLKYDVRNRQAIRRVLLRKGFLCLPIRASCFIIGVVSLVTSFILMGGLFATLVENQLKNVINDEFTWWAFSLIFFAAGFDIVASASLLVGSLIVIHTMVIQRELTQTVQSSLCACVALFAIPLMKVSFGMKKQGRSLVVPYAILHFVLIVVGFLAMGLGSVKVTTTWKDTAMSIAVQGLSIYVWMIVISYYQIMADPSTVAEKLIR